MMTIEDAARQWKISERRVRLLCSSGRIAGAAMVNHSWHIPDGTSKPEDMRSKRTLAALLKDIEARKGWLWLSSSWFERRWQAYYIHSSQTSLGSLQR